MRDEDGRITALPELERIVSQAFEAMRSAQSRRPARQRLLWNRLLLYAWPAIDIRLDEAGAIIARFARETAGLGLELVMLRARMRADGAEHDRALRIFNPAGRGVVVEVGDPPTQPLQPLDEGAQRIVSARARHAPPGRDRQDPRAPAAEPGAAIPPGEFVEHDLDATASSFPSSARQPPTARASSSA